MTIILCADSWPIIGVAAILCLSPASTNEALGAELVPICEGLEVSVLGSAYKPGPRTIVAQQVWDRGGNTSVRFTSREHLVWKAEGYFQRNRDLGQVFMAPKEFVLSALVLRTGPADGAVLQNAPGAEVFVQFFEVEGEPQIDDNGTGPGARAAHGFSTNHRCDDFLVGVTYKPLIVVKGAYFPNLPPTRDEHGRPTGNRAGALVYLRFSLAEAVRPRFQAARRYAFLVGFVVPARERGFTLANRNAASAPDPPAIGDPHDAYPLGWAIRREGNGAFPPLAIPANKPPSDENVLETLLDQAVFPPGMARYFLEPGTNGYPDVDTYRDLEFYLEE